jgi:hypothetical protein
MNLLFIKKLVLSKLLLAFYGLMIAVSLTSCSRKADQTDTTTYPSSTMTNRIMGTSTNEIMTNNPTMGP